MAVCPGGALWEEKEGVGCRVIRREEKQGRAANLAYLQCEIRLPDLARCLQNARPDGPVAAVLAEVPDRQ